MINSGLIDGGGPVLAPSRALERPTVPGIYGARLGPTWLGAKRGAPLESMAIGLLLQPPKPEGDRWLELSCEGYSRQIVRLEQIGTGRVASTTAALFDLAAPCFASVRHLGIFDEDELLYFGALVLTQSTSGGLQLPPRSLQVKWGRPVTG